MNELQSVLDHSLEFARSIGAEITSFWFYGQLALIGLAAVCGAAASLVFSKRFDLVSLTMGWPPSLRRVVRSIIDNLGFVVFIVLAVGIRAAMLAMTWPSRSYFLGVAVNLATAWVIISVVASQIRTKLVFRTVALAAWLVAALSILGVLDRTATALDNFSTNFGDLRLSALLIIKAVVFLSIALWIATGIGNYFESKVRGATDLSASLQVLIGKLVKLSLYTMTIVVVLNSIGFDLSSLFVFSGAIGVGLGFGMQKIVSNFVSGIILLADKSIKPGDVISVGESFGWVDTMGARYSSIVSRDGREFLIPNEDFVTQRVINWSHSNDRIRLDVPFGLSYGCDPHQVRKLAVEASAISPRVLRSPEPVCHITKFGESSLDFVLRFWIRDPAEGVTNVRGSVMLELWDAFKREGIEIPFPVRDLRAAQPIHVVVDREHRTPDRSTA